MTGIFGHDKDFVYQERGFNSIQEHDETILNNINSIVEEDDTLYVLGDLMLGDNEAGIEKIKRIKCQNIFIILGNHDSNSRIELYKTVPSIKKISYADVLKIGKAIFYLSHYPTICSNYDDGQPWHRRIVNLYGHTHQKWNFYYDNNPMTPCGNPFMYHVGVDSHACTPVAAEDIIAEIREYKCQINNLHLTK